MSNAADPTGAALAEPGVQMLVHLMGAQMNATSASAMDLARAFAIGERKTQATLALVRRGVRELVSGPYAPNPAYVLGALYPTEEDVEQWLADHYGSGDATDGQWREVTSTFRRCYRCAGCRR